MKLVLGLAAGLLVVVLGLQWRDWAPTAGLPAAPSERLASASVAPAERAGADSSDMEPPPKEDYASVMERPLFLPDRRPPPEQEDEEPEPEEVPLTELDGVDLTAVVITPVVVSAWVRGGPTNPELTRLRLGDEYEGWTVKTIEPSLLVLERQGDINELHLRDYEHAPPPIPPTQLVPRTPARGVGAGGDDVERARGRAADPQATEGADGQPNRQPVVRRPVRQPPARRSATAPGAEAIPAQQPPRRAPIRRSDAIPPGQ